jgi:quinol monooxygenase YgiN
MEQLIVRITRSFNRATGRHLFSTLDLSPSALLSAARSAPFVLLSHGPEADPLLAFANTAAIALFSLETSDLGTLPTRLTAAAEDQAERARLLSTVAAKGFCDDYAGPRRAKCGRTFTIRGATVWNVLDDAGALCGQAATFASWEETGVLPRAVAHVHVSVTPGAAGLFKMLTADNALHSRREPGCLGFEVHQAMADPLSFILVEEFRDAAAAAAHKQTEHYLRWRDAVAPLMAAPRRAEAFLNVA